MSHESSSERSSREWILRRAAKPNSRWLRTLAQTILSADPERRSLKDWLRDQGTGPPHVQRIAFYENAPNPDLPRVTSFRQTEKEYIFLRTLLALLAAGHDVREMLGIKAHKVGHRPPDPIAEKIAIEVEKRIQEGDPVKKAISDVAALTGRTEYAVRGIRQRHSKRTKGPSI